VLPQLAVPLALLAIEAAHATVKLEELGVLLDRLLVGGELRVPVELVPGALRLFGPTLVERDRRCRYVGRLHVGSVRRVGAVDAMWWIVDVSSDVLLGGYAFGVVFVAAFG